MLHRINVYVRNRRQLTSWIGLTKLLLVIIIVIWPMQGMTVNREVEVDAETETWLEQADASTTETFLVLLRDDGTQARVNQAQVMRDKITRRTHAHTVLSERAERNELVLRAMLNKRGVANEVQDL